MVRLPVRIVEAALLIAALALGAQDTLPAPQDEIVRVGTPGVTPPEPVYRFDPAYTMDARQAGLQGTVRLSLVIDEKGIPRDITVRKPVGMGLDERALETVRQWRFRPAILGDRPVKFGASIEVPFRLWRKGWSIADITFPEQPGVSQPVITKAPFTNEWSLEPGLFRLVLRVDERGAPSEIGIAMSSNRALDGAAVNSVRKWRFRPAMRDGKPLTATGTVELSFNPEAPKPRLH